MSKKTLYHGSEEMICRPVFGKGKTYNDYGQGFYCTKHLELAKEWACTENGGGYVNQYRIDTKGMHILNLSSDEYTILHWLALLMEYRKFRISTPIMRRGAEWLKENYLLDIRMYDMLIGYRADDSYFSFARAFVGNEISLHQLSYAMKLGSLGEQFVLKSSRAFDAVEFVSAVPVDHTQYYIRRKKRDDDARAAYRAELENEDAGGLYMRDIIREEVRADDPRLR